MTAAVLESSRAQVDEHGRLPGGAIFSQGRIYALLYHLLMITEGGVTLFVFLNMSSDKCAALVEGSSSFFVGTRTVKPLLDLSA